MYDLNEIMQDFKNPENVDFEKLKNKYYFRFAQISFDSIVNNPELTSQEKALLIVFNLGWKQRLRGRRRAS